MKWLKERGLIKMKTKKRRSKPCQHVRRVKTRKGTVRKLINKGVRKRVVSKVRKKNYGFLSFADDDTIKARVEKLKAEGLSNKEALRLARVSKGLVKHAKDAIAEERERRKAMGLNYGFLSKSIKWNELAKAQKEFEDDDVGFPSKDEQGNFFIEQRDMPVHKFLDYVDFNKGFRELGDHGVKVTDSQKRLFSSRLRSGDYEGALKVLPREARIDLNLATNARNIVKLSKQKNKR